MSLLDGIVLPTDYLNKTHISMIYYDIPMLWYLFLLYDMCKKGYDIVSYHMVWYMCMLL